jgi:hypothetical protein
VILAKSKPIQANHRLREHLDYPNHLRQLTEESGIDADVILERGYRTVKSKAELARLGFSRVQQLTPALLIPMYSPMGEVTPRTRSSRTRHARTATASK